MTKVVYESIVIIFSATIIFACTLSSVLLVLLWPHTQIFGVDTRIAIATCAVAVCVFSVGLVGTIAESFRALNVYACLLVVFPFGVLLVELAVRLSLKPFDGVDQLLTGALAVLLMQIVVAYLLAREIRRLTILHRGINYKICRIEDGLGSEIQLCETTETEPLEE